MSERDKAGRTNDADKAKKEDLVVLGVTGCIAAYKAADVIRGLRRGGCRVVPVLTENAEAFITPFTLQNLAGTQAVTGMFDLEGNYDVRHIPLATEASLLLVAPASANCIGKLACGIADDFLTTLYLAMEKPVLLAPAMNTKMYNHPVVRENIERLRARGVHFAGPVEGILATGHYGMGHLAPVDAIVEAALALVRGTQTLRGRRILVTAGPTVESIDAVRFISNRSSGKMGFALAAEARNRGASVVLVSGPVSIPAPGGVSTVFVRSAADMHREVIGAFDASDVVIMCAAVADFRPVSPSPGKLHKKEWSGTLELEKTVDILEELGKKKKAGQILVGFAAEDRDLRSAAEAKRAGKNLDLIVANDIASQGIGMGSDFSRALILDSDGKAEEYPHIPKSALAAKVLDAVERRMP
jgi:phosphopantothenoylcysteine decarboxylase/phosphopantothenate--cysteine ligase